ncbi:MAG: FMN reductase, partial [Burkholderiaceae bacterium]|nr:FMN reductase [Burkholderiaceae bacterium]
RAVLEKLGLLVIPESIALGAAHTAFDESGSLKDPKVDKIAKSVGAALTRTASRLA